MNDPGLLFESKFRFAEIISFKNQPISGQVCCQIFVDSIEKIVVFWKLNSDKT